MKKVLTKNSILDEGDSTFFNLDGNSSSMQTPKKTKKQHNKSTRHSSGVRKPVKTKKIIKQRRQKEVPPPLPIADEVEDTLERTSELDPKTISIITVSEKISKRLAQNLWQELSPQTLKSLQDLILNIYIEPVVLATSKSDKVRDRLRELIQELIQELSKKLLDVKLPVIKSSSFLDLESILNKKIYLESVLSSNLKQIEILEKELIRFEKVYKNDLTYYNNLKKAIDKDDLVKDVSVEDNLDHELMNIRKLSIQDDKDDVNFELVLTRLDKHLMSIDNNVKELIQLNDKVELVNELLLLL